MLIIGISFPFCAPLLLGVGILPHVDVRTMGFCLFTCVYGVLYFRELGMMSAVHPRCELAV